jgi:hypothetical protein
MLFSGVYRERTQQLQKKPSFSNPSIEDWMRTNIPSFSQFH